MGLAANQLHDPSIRSAYEKAVKKSARVSLSEIQEIIAAARDGYNTNNHGMVKDFITETEKMDLKKILGSADLSDPAKEELEEFIDRRKKQKDPSERKELGEQGRKRVGDVIDHLGATVKFLDPVFNVQYNTGNYNKIAKRIRSGKIKVYFYEYVADDALSGRARGLYQSNGNTLSYTSQSDYRKTHSTILHEATHAIQDIVINQNMERYHAEAMAHVAQAIAIIQSFGEGVLFDRVKEMKDIAKSVIQSKKVTHAQIKEIIKIFQNAGAYSNGKGMVKFGDN